jgi:hypothetical protein
MTRDELLALVAGEAGRHWLTDAEAGVRADPDSAASVFARAGRALGRQPLPDRPGWTPALAGRILLLLALADPGRTAQLYRHGDAAERLAVLRALPLLPMGDAGVPLAEDALRTNDPRLVAAALGPYAARLDPATWRQGVVKCVFMGIPLNVVDRLDERADDALAEMLTALACERAAAGRSMPADALALLDRHPLRKER